MANKKVKKENKVETKKKDVEILLFFVIIL